MCKHMYRLPVIIPRWSQSWNVFYVNISLQTVVQSFDSVSRQRKVNCEIHLVGLCVSCCDDDDDDESLCLLFLPSKCCVVMLWIPAEVVSDVNSISHKVGMLSVGNWLTKSSKVTHVGIFQYTGTKHAFENTTARNRTTLRPIRRTHRGPIQSPTRPHSAAVICLAGFCPPSSDAACDWLMFGSRAVREWVYCSFPEWLTEQIQIELSQELWFYLYNLHLRVYLYNIYNI